jgi:N-formylglutamate deformylase
VPHCGTEFPEEIIAHYNEERIQKPDDTDWFVHQLYEFATHLGITIIYAKYSRWVIDLNRDPESKPLYDDGRIITSLTPNTDFFGNKIYKNADFEPNSEEVNRRLETYYWPYYRAIESLLEERKKEFGKVILWDAHSIRRHVPTIRKEPFPDMILGTNDEKSAGREIMHVALTELRKGSFQVNYNDPFKGGHITRYFGKPELNQHALQLEMNKVLYMNDAEIEFHTERANKVSALLRNTFAKLIEA